MATVQWPEDVPIRFPQDSYNVIDDTGVIYSPPDSGRVKSRRRFAATITRKQLTVIVTEAERDTLRRWIKDNISGGAVEFCWYNAEGTEALETVLWVIPRGGIRWRAMSRRPRSGPALPDDDHR